MSGYINVSGNYRFEDIGIVHVNVRSNARNVRARWRGGQLLVSAPTGIGYDELHRILLGFMPRLEQRRPDSLYSIGDKYDFGELKIEITEQHYQPEKIISRYRDGMGTIAVGSAWDLSKPQSIKQISRFMCRMAQYKAPDVLIPRGVELAASVGRKPNSWTISKGHRILGHCNSRGVIALSYALMFYPQHLRDYVIYHELAHLSELNHSPRFHEICNMYCGGREKELVAELRAYKLPIVK